MYHHPNKLTTPRQSTWERQVPNEHKVLSPFTESIRSNIKQPHDNSRSERKELIQRTLQSKFRNVYESPGKRNVEVVYARNASQVMPLRELKGAHRMSVERAQSDAGTPLHHNQFNTYSTRSKRIRDVDRRNDEIRSARNIDTPSQHSCNAIASEIRIEDNVVVDKKTKPVNNNGVRNNLAINHKLQASKSYSEKNFKSIAPKNDKAQRYKDIEEKLEVYSTTHKIETNKANREDSVRSQPVERKASNLSKAYSERSKCSGCGKNGLEYVCTSCVNRELAKQKEKQIYKERQLNLLNDHKQLQRIEELKRKYMEEAAALKKTMNEEMKVSLEEAEQRKKRLKEEE
jgi:hypothetical protein